MKELSEDKFAMVEQELGGSLGRADEDPCRKIESPVVLLCSPTMPWTTRPRAPATAAIRSSTARC
ncbi:MAG: hypothetical protein R3D80_21680 [Paracoccaceae bacterium]